MDALLGGRCTTQHHAVSVAPALSIRNANSDSLGRARRFPLLDNFVGYHENGDLSMLIPSPRRCMASSRRTRKGSQVSVLTLGL